MDSARELEVILLSISLSGRIPFLNYFYEGEHRSAVLLNPEILRGSLLSGTVLEIRLKRQASDARVIAQAELCAGPDDFIPAAFVDMLEKQPPAQAVHFGWVSDPVEDAGRYYMLRDHNEDGLLLYTGEYEIRNGKGCCREADGQWPLRYDIVENFFYGIDRPECGIEEWTHPQLKLKRIDETLTIKQLTKRFRNDAAGWHRYNFFFSDDWSKKFYLRQARLGFIAITHEEGGLVRLTPQLQREYAVLDWDSLHPGKKVRRIIDSGRIEAENIKLVINPDPSEALANLISAWDETWITADYAELITSLAEDCKRRLGRNFRIWGITLTAGPENEIIAGELGYSIGKTYTSLSGFFHRGNRRYNNFGKLQMVMLAELLKKSGIAFWNLGQPYMAYKLKLGADVVPRGLFLKRWDKAVRGRTPDLSLNTR